MSTLPGIAFYESCGFLQTGNYELELAAGVKLELVPMRKEFDAIEMTQSQMASFGPNEIKG
jgi:hypothetical protein